LVSLFFYSRAPLGPAFVNPVTKKWVPNQAEVQVNVDRNKGFLRIGPITNTTNAFWQQFIM